MTSFNTTFDWDTNLPTSISALDENDFLLLLQKQFPVVNTGDLPVPPASLFKEKPVSDSNAQSLNKFRLPQSTSPTSSDSSPSPPSPNDDASANGSTENGHKKSDSTEEDHHKRKASADNFEDDIGGQPSNKAQHMDSKSKKPGGNIRRKPSGADRNQDESRLLKRKEQNRAAQRAFRERKEKHVKDLEDKVAQLEAKTESQEAENENLRDMLSRLQSENLMLKQTAFTFAVPSSSSNNTPTTSLNKPGASSPERRKSSGASSESLNLFSGNIPGPSSVPASAGSSIASASTHDSPSSIFETFDSFSNMQNAEASSSVSTTANNPNPNPTSSTPDMDTLAYFGAPGPFTTISSNPLFTSYRDPSLSVNAFASYGGWEGDVAMTGASAAQDNSNAGLDGLFGDQFSGLIPFSGDFITGEASASTASSGSSPAARLSPVVHHKPKPAAEGHSSSGTCPKTKGDIERLVATGGRSTFGSPPPGMDETRNTPPAANPAPGAPGRQSEYDAAVDRAFGMAPKKECTDNSNIDDLCLEMQRKARCSYAATAWSQ